MRSLLVGLCLVGVLSFADAKAQDMMIDMTSNMSYSAMTNIGTAAMCGYDGVCEDDTVTQGRDNSYGTQNLAPPSSLLFTPSQAVREQVYAEYLGAAARADIAKGTGGQDLIDFLSGPLGERGLSTENVADAMAVWAISAWSTVNADTSDTDRATAAAVKGRLAAGLLSSPEIASMSDADKQRFAEQMLVYAFGYETALQQKDTYPAAYDMAVEAARKHAGQLGFDIDAVTLVPGEGFRPKGSTPAAPRTSAPAPAPAAQSGGAAYVATLPAHYRRDYELIATSIGMRLEDMFTATGDYTEEAKRRLGE